MSEVWVYRVEVLEVPDDESTMPDIAGFEVLSSDGHKLGKVDQATYEAGSGWIVVDTGFWVFGKKRMVPAGAIESIDLDAREVRLGLTKEQIKQAPDFDEVRRDQDAYRQELGEYYAGS
jgi:ribosomal 30S subunit maturation factor RimM